MLGDEFRVPELHDQPRQDIYLTAEMDAFPTKHSPLTGSQVTMAELEYLRLVWNPAPVRVGPSENTD